eukprot:1735580-Pleurochrysis_carterae.AAC.3
MELAGSPWWQWDTTQWVGWSMRCGARACEHAHCAALQRVRAARRRSAAAQEHADVRSRSGKWSSGSRL